MPKRCNPTPPSRREKAIISSGWRFQRTRTDIYASLFSARNLQVHSKESGYPLIEGKLGDWNRQPLPGRNMTVCTSPSLHGTSWYKLQNQYYRVLFVWRELVKLSFDFENNSSFYYLGSQYLLWSWSSIRALSSVLLIPRAVTFLEHSTKLMLPI